MRKVFENENHLINLERGLREDNICLYLLPNNIPFIMLKDRQGSWKYAVEECKRRGGREIVL